MAERGVRSRWSLAGSGVRSLGFLVFFGVFVASGSPG